MTTYGLTGAGLVIKTLDDCVDDIETDLQSAFGASIDLSSTSNFGQLAGSMGERFSELWALVLAVFNAQTAEGATGTAEDSVNSLTGCIREAAIASVVSQTLTGTNGTAIAEGSIVAVTGQDGNQFETDALVTLATAPSWGHSQSHVVGDYVTNAGNIYYCTQLGVTASTGSGPTGTTLGAAIDDSTVVWTYVGQGAAYAVVQCTATSTGPLAGLAGTIVVIVTPISGWFGTWNALAALVGANVETDSTYRARRDAELGENGEAYLNAIEAAVLQVGAGTDNPVTACTVFENYTDTTVSGRPPHSVECLVQGGDNLAVATAIFNSIAAGIRPFGQTNTVTETVVDSEGNAHTVQFSRPSPVNVYVSITVTVNPNSPNFIAADGGQAAIQAQIISWGNQLGAGFSVDQSFASAQAFIANVGAWQVTSCTVGTAPSPVGSEVVITAAQIAYFGPEVANTQVVVTITQTVP